MMHDIRPSAITNAVKKWKNSLESIDNQMLVLHVIMTK